MLMLTCWSNEEFGFQCDVVLTCWAEIGFLRMLQLLFLAWCEREFRCRFHVHFFVLNSYRLRFVEVMEESGLWVLPTRDLVKLKVPSIILPERFLLCAICLEELWFLNVTVVDFCVLECWEGERVCGLWRLLRMIIRVMIWSLCYRF